MVYNGKNRGLRLGKVVALMLCVVLLASLSSCGQKVPVMTVNGVAVSDDEYLFYLNFMKEQVMTQYQLEDDPLIWDTVLPEGMTVREFLQDVTSEQLTGDKVSLQMAQDQDIKLTTADVRTIDEYMTGVRNTYGTEVEYNNALKESFLSKELLRSIHENDTMVTKMYEKMFEQFTDEQLMDYYMNEMVRVKHILLITYNADTGEGLSQAELDEVKEKIEAIYELALDGEDFDALIEEHSEDPGSFTVPEGYLVGPNSGMTKKFEEAALALKVGEISKITETEYGYHIIKRIENPEDDFENKIDSIKSVIATNEVKEQVANATVEVNKERADELFARLAKQ